LSTSNEIGLKSISELLGWTFFIPSYQRGYRWDEQQIKDLLDDIYSFAVKKKENDKEYYCLQPIVVRKFKKDDKDRIEITKDLQSGLNNQEWYEVIDGQQRLTTIRILISYFEKDLYRGQSFHDRHKIRPFEILYETRPDSNSFLENIDDSKSKDFIDYDFISNAYKVIYDWFNSFEKGDPQTAKEKIRNTLTNKPEAHEAEGTVQVIWYELEDENYKPIDIFLRINMGKISLTSAELIKALFLQKRNFGKDDDVAKLRQMQIASEWDEMEYALQNDDFWWFLNMGKNETPARIEFLFSLIYELERQNKEKKSNNQNFDKRFGTDEYKIFRYFNSLFPDDVNYDEIKKEWDKIKDYFYAFEEWFNKPVWYHYIGFLIYCGVSVIDIYEKIYRDKKKVDFTKALKDKIKKETIIEYGKDKDSNFIINLSYDAPKDKIRQFFLLFNIEFIVQQYNDSEEDVFILKFPFKTFKSEDWDIEHINSFTTKLIKDKKTAEEWLGFAEVDFGDKLEELKNKIKIFKDAKTDFSTFEPLREEIIKKVGEDNINEEMKKSIGNLTLLDAGTNRGYGNAFFLTKRRKIIEKDKAGKFIPICTKHVFLKYFDEAGTSVHTKWDEDDITKYQNHIGTVLNDYLNPYRKSANSL
jgi:hypothetical protein